MSLRSIATCLVFCLLLSPTWAAADPFAELVQSTEPLSPEEERAAFVLPKGFEMQLVAAEPDLRKPMNMAFDVTGRLWFTESREYPFPVKPGEVGRDSIRILSDIGEDGRAKKVTIFAEGLNIPIGLYPFRSLNKETGKVTWKCIAWSIPNIWLFEDTDGDDKADKKTELYGPLGWEKDTHGNLASFRRGADGWLYGTHGFNNTSTMRGKDGSSITMQSGNTWRVALDGSRVEQITFGQVNPFGLCFDQRGNMFTADCHSSPIYQLIRGACYPSFGKPHDGLGFAPTTIQHTHGSTALCGIVYLDDMSWGDEYKDNIIVGNVGTSRINRDRIEWRGTTSVGHELPDFLSTRDPWFRPVDLQIGPDGALYIADFYNKIIGHYEVPLTHPGRDRERGRIWRMVYRGEQGDKKLEPLPLPNTKSGLIDELASQNPTRRMLALHELADNHLVDPSDFTLDQLKKNIWLMQGASIQLMQRQGRLSEEMLPQIFGSCKSINLLPGIQAAAEFPTWTPETRKLIQEPFLHLKHANPFEVRAAVHALGMHPDSSQVELLLDAYEQMPESDTHLRHATKIALRNQLRVDTITSALPDKKWNALQIEHLFNLLEAAGTPAANSARIKLIGNYPPNYRQAAMQYMNLYLKAAEPERKELIEYVHAQRDQYKPLEYYHLLNKFLTVNQRDKDSPSYQLLQQLCGEAIEPLQKLGLDGTKLAMQMASLQPNLVRHDFLLKYFEPHQPLELRASAATGLFKGRDPATRRLVLDALLSPQTDAELRRALGFVVINHLDSETTPAIIQAIRMLPASAQMDLTKALVSDKEASQTFVASIDQHQLPATLLRDKAVQDRLRAHKDAALTKQLDAILAKLPPANVELDKLIAKRKTAATKAEGNADHGLAVYKKTCAACHKLNNEGALVGPQLDGIGGRGLERLLEDVLDPNRNVDRAFRMTLITKKDGTVTSGLVRKDEGDDLLMVNQQGQEFTVKKDDIDERAEATTSLMPSVAESLPEGDLLDLIAYLLKQKPKSP